MSWLQPIMLTGNNCKLEPLSIDHLKGLVSSVRDGELWKLWYTLIPHPDEMEHEIKRRLTLQAEGSMLPFTILNHTTNQIIGMMTYLNADHNNLRVEIGGSWLGKSMQGSGINVEAKLLLLSHAFEVLNCNVVEFRTHFLNKQSRKGIEKLGAKLDGILRNHMIMPNATIRDTCVYSILHTEWPTLKIHLKYLIDRCTIKL